MWSTTPPGTPQLIPGGELTTVPEPGPASVTLSGTSKAKFAFTTVAPETATVHWFGFVVLAVQPVKPVKADPAAAVAVSTTLVPVPTVALHAVPQSMGGAALCTVPCPFPVFWTVSVDAYVNFALTTLGIRPSNA